MRVPAGATWAMVLLGAVEREVDEATPGTEHPAVVPLHGSDHPDRLRQLVDADALDQVVVADPASGDPPGQDVDCQQLAAAAVPPDALTELGLLGLADDGVAAPVVALAVHRQPPKSTTTLMSSGPRCRASAILSGGTRREISRASQSRSAAASASAAR